MLVYSGALKTAHILSSASPHHPFPAPLRLRISKFKPPASMTNPLSSPAGSTSRRRSAWRPRSSGAGSARSGWIPTSRLRSRRPTRASRSASSWPTASSSASPWPCTRARAPASSTPPAASAGTAALVRGRVRLMLGCRRETIPSFPCVRSQATDFTASLDSISPPRAREVVSEVES